MAPAQPSILRRVLSVFRPRPPPVHESKEDHEISPPPPPYVATDPALPADEKQNHSTTQALTPQNAPSPHLPTSPPSTSTQLYIRQHLSDARTTRAHLIRSFNIVKSLGHSSTTQWALNNPDPNVDRMRQFLHHWLTREYIAEVHSRSLHQHNPSTEQYTASPHGAHFICLARLLFYLVPFQNLHGWAAKDQRLKEEIWAYVKVHLRAPLLALEINEPHIVQVLQYFFQLADTTNAAKGAHMRVHEQFARDGWFGVLQANIAADMEMVGKVVPDEESHARGILVRAIKDTRALYFVSVDEGSSAFSPTYLLTDYARKNLCPCCRDVSSTDHVGAAKRPLGGGGAERGH